MLDVIIALLPATIVGIYFYKVQALAIILISITASVITEAIWQKLCNKKITINDLSAVVTGLILALILPVHVPLWIPAIGSVFATLIVKQFYGGLGNNFMNPAIAAKVFLMISWAAVMIKPVVDATSAASEGEWTAEAVAVLPSIWDMFLYQEGGNIGELSVAALVIGGIYLLLRRVINFKIPLTFILFFALASWSFGGKEAVFTGDPIRALMSGVVMMAVFFMANDPSTSPKNNIVQFIFGACCGILGAILKYYGYNNEGPYYAIMIMNVFIPIIEKFISERKSKLQVKEAV